MNRRVKPKPSGVSVASRLPKGGPQGGQSAVGQIDLPPAPSLVRRGSLAGWYLCLTLALFLPACGNDGGGDGGNNGPAAISTLAYVVTICDQPAGHGLATFQQALWVRQGEREPVKVMELPAVPMPLCRTLADTRDGSNSLFAGAFQRMGVSPDGAVVLFEVTYDFSPFRFEPWAKLPPEQEGIFLVHGDGTGLRKVGPNSQQPGFALDPACYIPGTDCAGGTASASFDFSPDRKLVALTDRGPDNTGKMSAQVFTLNLASGAREQVTTLPPLPRCGTPAAAQGKGTGPVALRHGRGPASSATVDRCTPSPSDDECLPRELVPIHFPRFIDARTIAFYRPSAQDRFGTPFTVTTDTKELCEIPRVAIGQGVFVPVFGITGDPIGFTNGVPGTPVNGSGPYGNSVTEAFVTDGTNIVQITRFGRSETVNTRVTLDRTRVIFEGSPNPPELDTNPRNYCQVFSAGVLGGDVRQVTFFGTDAPGCNCGAAECRPPACTGTGFYDSIDWGTGSYVFGSSCDPSGANPTLVGQIFALRPDGSSLRQLTFTRGIEESADGSLHVELAGPFAVATRLR